MHHTEHHVTSSATLKDIVLGMSDGLTVPFALAAGLSGAVHTTGLIVIAGVAEIAAGAIAMALGGYLAAKTEAEHYDSEYRRECQEVEESPHVEEAEVAEILQEFGLTEAQIPTVVNALKTNPKRWVDFMMRFELGLEKPDRRRLLYSPLTIGLAYALGGLIPLFPYMLFSQVFQALWISIGLTLCALFVFGGVKGWFTGKNPVMSGLQTLLIGACAATVAFIIARLID